MESPRGITLSLRATALELDAGFKVGVRCELGLGVVLGLALGVGLGAELDVELGVELRVGLGAGIDVGVRVGPGLSSATLTVPERP